MKIYLNSTINNAFNLMNKYGSGCLVVIDKDVKRTIVELAENMNIVVEPGGAVAATALLTNKISIKNKNVIVMISGGNIDYNLFSSFVNNQL